MKSEANWYEIESQWVTIHATVPPGGLYVINFTFDFNKMMFISFMIEDID